MASRKTNWHAAALACARAGAGQTSIAAGQPHMAQEALRLHDIGLAVVPAVAEDGKSVEGVVSGFQVWRRRLPRAKVEQLFMKHPGACIALLVGHCGLVVVDCDSDDALAAAEQRFGHTPVLVRTPSGRGGHLYYRAPPGEEVRQANLRRREGLAIDVKAGKGAYVVCPPSVRPSSGMAYTFERGGWADLPRLPVFRRPPAGGAAPGGQIPDGERGRQLFKRALRLAPDCETAGELALKLHAVNEVECEPPLAWELVDKTAASAWGYQVRGKNRVGRGRYVRVPETRLERLKDDADAFLLDTVLRLKHQGLRTRFAASPRAMERADVLPAWSAKRYRCAIAALVERGVLARLRSGGRGPRDPHLYGFAEGSPEAPVLGAEIAPNTNKTPLPPFPEAGMAAAAVSARVRGRRAA